MTSNEDFIFASAAGRPRNIVDSSAKRLNTISKGHVFNSPNLFGQIHRESGRVHFVRNTRPNKAPCSQRRSGTSGEEILSLAARLALAALDTHQGAGAYGADFLASPRKKWWAL